MTKFYELKNNIGFIIYPYQNNIILRQKSGDNFSRPKILTSDYKDNLCDTLYDNIIYYSYIDINNHLIIRRTSDYAIHYMLDTSPHSISPIKLANFSGKIILFYEEQIDFQYKRLKCLFPFIPNLTLDINDKLLLNSKINICSFDANLIIQFHTQTHQKIYSINTNLQISELETSSNYNKLLQQKDYEIRRLTATLESAKKQYNDLMEVANKYREEALKWCSKFTTN